MSDSKTPGIAPHTPEAAGLVVGGDIGAGEDL